MKQLRLFPSLTISLSHRTQKVIRRAKHVYDRMWLRNSITGKNIVVKFESPLEKRLRRMRRRLGVHYNYKEKTYDPLNGTFNHFTMVTFREGASYEAFKANKVGFIRRFMNAWRMAFHRIVKDKPFYYFWVLEKGHKGTKRYHFHIMTNWVPKIFQNSMPLPNRVPHLEHMWGNGFVCSETIRNTWGAAAYAAKYCSKEGIKNRGIRGYGASINIKAKKSDWTWQNMIFKHFPMDWFPRDYMETGVRMEQHDLDDYMSGILAQEMMVCYRLFPHKCDNIKNYKNLWH